MTVTSELSDIELEAKRAKYRAAYHKNKHKHVGKTRARSKKWHEDNPNKLRNWQLKSAYGITYEQRDSLFESQGKACAICKDEVPRTKQGWNVDHCHASGKVRGILCSHCNWLLGNAKDSTDILSSAISYLKDFEARQYVN